jgi:hypothetical protein
MLETHATAMTAWWRMPPQISGKRTIDAEIAGNAKRPREESGGVLLRSGREG